MSTLGVYTFVLRYIRVCENIRIRYLTVQGIHVLRTLTPPRAPSLSHSHSRAHTHARGACPVCLCVLLLPPQDKNTPLHSAAELGHKDVAELLLGHKADVNSVNEVSADGCAEG